MRQAPPVSVRCDGSLAWRLLHVFLAAAAAASLTAWILLHAGAGVLSAAMASAAAAVLAGALGWHQARPEPALLGGDGRGWTLDGAPGQVEVMIDLGPWMLLRFRPQTGAARWLPWPGTGPARHGLRAALYARSSGAVDHAVPPATGPSD